MTEIEKAAIDIFENNITNYENNYAEVINLAQICDAARAVVSENESCSHDIAMTFCR